MRILRYTLALAFCWRAMGEPFQNLGFDEANTNNLIRQGFPPELADGWGAPTDLLPGWTLLRDGPPVAEMVWLNVRPAGLGVVSLYDVNNRYFLDDRYRFPVSGAYSFVMIPQSSQLPPAVHFRLLQTGQVPEDAEWLEFTNFGQGFDVSINGTPQRVSYVPGPPAVYPDLAIKTARVYVLPFAGQTVELGFRSLDTFGSGMNVCGLDSIRFVPIPEPAASAICGTGLVLLFALGRIGRRKQRPAGTWRKGPGPTCTRPAQTPL